MAACYEDEVLNRVACEQASRQINAALATLTTIEQRVVAMRLGLLDGHALSFREIGQELGFSRQNAQRIEKQAREKMKRKPRKTLPKG